MTAPTPPAEPGATPPAEPTTAPPAEPATGDGLGEAGRKALEAERTARKELEKQIKALESRDPLKELLAKLGDQPVAPGTDPVAALAERVTKAEERAAKAELDNLRTAVRDAKGLTAEQAAELRGSTLEDLAAHADRLLAAFPAAANGNGATTGIPRPDPSQGARGSSNHIEAAITEARKKGDTREVIRLMAILGQQQPAR